MWGVLRYYNLLRVGVTWKGPEIIELWYNQCDSSKGSVTTTATQCYHYYVNGSSDNTNGSDDECDDRNDDVDGHDDVDYDYDNHMQQYQQPPYKKNNNGIHQSANTAHNLNSLTDTSRHNHHNNKNINKNENSSRNLSGHNRHNSSHNKSSSTSTSTSSYMVQSTSMLRRCPPPHQQTVLEQFTYNNGYGEGSTATDNDSISSDVDENDSLLGGSEVNFISLVWHKFIYAT